MNFEGSHAIAIPRYGSSCSYDDSVNLPLGLAYVATNVRYTAQSVATRFGHSTQLRFGENNSLTGGGLLRYLAAQPGTLDLQAVETILVFAYGSVTGSLYSCPPFIQAAMAVLNTAGEVFGTRELPVRLRAGTKAGERRGAIEACLPPRSAKFSPQPPRMATPAGSRILR